MDMLRKCTICAELTRCCLMLCWGDTNPSVVTSSDISVLVTRIVSLCLSILSKWIIELDSRLHVGCIELRRWSDREYYANICMNEVEGFSGPSVKVWRGISFHYHTHLVIVTRNLNEFIGIVICKPGHLCSQKPVFLAVIKLLLMTDDLVFDKFVTMV